MQAAATTGALSMAERSYPTSEVRGRSQEDTTPEGRWPRGVTPHPRSGAVAKSARLRWRRNGREELPCVQGWGGGQEELPDVRGQGQWPGGATPRLRSGEAAGRSYPTPTGPRPEVAAGRTNPMSKEPWLHRRRRA